MVFLFILPALLVGFLLALLVGFFTRFARWFSTRFARGLEGALQFIKSCLEGLDVVSFEWFG